MGYYKVHSVKRRATQVTEFTAEQYKLATSKESIAMSQALGGTDTNTKYGLRSASPDGEEVSHFVASPSAAPEYIRAAIREHEAGKE